MIVDSEDQLPFLNITIPKKPCESSSLNLSCFVQALRLFRLATELETRAAHLRFEGLQHMTVAVTGVNCRELFTLLVTFFGQGMAFAEDPFAFLDGAPKIRPPLDLTNTDDTDDDDQRGDGDASSQVSAAASTSTTGTPAIPSEQKEPKVKSKPKVQYQDKIDDITATKGFLPRNSLTLHNTGIPLSGHVKRSGSSGRGRSLYVCSYADECSSPPYVGDLPSAASHVRKHHLGHCIACPYCGARYYNANGWHDHMGAKHAGLPWYRVQVNPTIPVCPAFPPDPSTGEAAASFPPPPSTIVEPSVDETISIPKGEDKEETGPDPPAGVPVSGIDRFSIEEMRCFMRFPPSNLQQWNYSIGGSWVSCHRHDDSQTKLLAEELVSQDVKREAATEDLGEEEEPIPSSQSQPNYPKRRYEFYEQGHYTKRWKEDPEDGAPPTE